MSSPARKSSNGALKKRSLQTVTISKQNISEAAKELKAKSYEQIEQETAIKWAARAIAASNLGKLKEAENYRHEAVEHAAFVNSEFLDSVMSEIDNLSTSADTAGANGSSL